MRALKRENTRDRLTKSLHRLAVATLLCLSAAPLMAGNPSSWVTYVTDTEVPGIFSIDAATNTATQAVGNTTGLPFVGPLGVAISADGSFSYVGDYLASGTYGTGTVYYIDTGTNTATQTVNNSTSTPFAGPVGIAISPNGKFAYMADFGNASVYFIDTATNTATQKVVNGYGFSNPAVVAISPDASFTYVTDSGAPAVYRIDTATNIVTAKVNGLSQPQGLAISPDGSFAYVADGSPPNIFQINTSTNTAAATTVAPFTTLMNPNGVAISPDGSTAYIADYGNNTVYYIDTTSNAVVHTVSVPNEAAFYANSIAVTPDGKSLYVGGGDTPTSAIYHIDVASRAVTQISNDSGVSFLYPSWPAFAILQISTTGLSGNNLAMANYFNAQAPRTVLRLFSPLQGQALSEALESAAPTRNAFLTFATQTTQIALGRLVYDQLRQDRWRKRAPMDTSLASSISEESLLVSAGKQIKAPPKSKSNLDAKQGPFSVWSGGFGEYAREKAQNQTPAFTTGSGGIVAAWDYSGKYVHPVGVGLAYAHTHLHEEGGEGSANIDQGDLFFYGTFTTGQWYFDTALWGGYYHAKNVRKIAFSTFSGDAKMKTHGWQLSPHLEVGYDYRLNWFGIEPFTLCDWVNCWEKEAHESGAGFLNMGQNGRYCSLLRSETGLHFEEILTYGWGTVTFMEKGSYAYQKTFHTGRLTAFLLGSPGSFTVDTLTGAQNLGVGEIEALFTPTSKRYPYASVSYHIELGSNYQSHQGMIKIGGDF